MRAIFQFFHNGWHWYSISVDTQKTGDPYCGGISNLKFSVLSILTKWEPFSIFSSWQIFHFRWHSEKRRHEFSIYSVFWTFLLVQFSPSPILGSVSIFMRRHLCIMTFLHLEIWRHEFSIDSVFWTFPSVQFSLSPILGSVSTLLRGYT